VNLESIIFGRASHSPFLEGIILEEEFLEKSLSDKPLLQYSHGIIQKD